MGVPAWLAGVGAELRSAIGDEFRAEAAAEERAVAEFRLRHRNLSDVATEMMHRGDAVTVSVGDSVVMGRLTHVASDLATLASHTAGRLHLNLDSTVTLHRNHAAPAGPGRSRDPLGYDSFPALLRSLGLIGSLVRLEANGPAGRLPGRIEAVAVDHVVFKSRETEWFVPLRAIYGVWE